MLVELTRQPSAALDVHPLRAGGHVSLLPILWAMKAAPVVDAEERVILMTLGESAWSDGTDAFPSKKTIAEIAKIDPKTVQRRLKSMTDRGLIAKGNQAAAAYIPEYFRPQVYDLMIPYSWFPDVDQVNSERKAKGKPPLRREDRPDLAEPPPRKKRADKGRRRKAADSGVGTTSPQGEDSESLGQTGQEGGSTRPGGGDYKSQRGGLQDPQPSPTNPPRDTPRPSVPDGSAAEQKDGGTDGSAVPHQIGRNPGVDLLLTIGAQQPEFLLTGKTLQDQGRVVAGMLLDGWTQEQMRQVIAGRPLPERITTTVGAIVSTRIRQALTGPAPDTVRASGGASVSEGADTFSRRVVIPMQCCSRCDRGFRSPEKGLCRDCREDVNA
jgi:hypothetical protein